MYRANCSISWSLKLLALVLAVALAGCGFRLRGTYEVPVSLQQLSVNSENPYGAITLLLKDRLRANGVALIAASQSANSGEIQLSNEVLEERTLSLFETGQVAEYELLYRIDVRLRSANGEPLEQQIRIQRQYQDNPDRALAKSREKELLLTEMREAAADRIIRLLASYSG
jgi:LPS-assembly lipoprotein